MGVNAHAHYQMPVLVKYRTPRASPGVSLRVYCISRVFRYTFIDFLFVSVSDRSYFCLLPPSVSVVEHCALQERLKEAAEESVQGEVTIV